MSFANAFEPSIRAASAPGPNTAKPAWRRLSATPATSGADHDEIGRDRPRQVEQALAIVGAYGVAGAERRDPRIAGRRVQLGGRRASHEPPGKGVLACARPDQQHSHAGECSARPVRASRW
jgi:hypothetical protein